MGRVRAVLECLEIAGRRREEEDGGATTRAKVLRKGAHTYGRGSSWARTSLIQFQEFLSPPAPCREERTLERDSFKNCVHASGSSQRLQLNQVVEMAGVNAEERVVGDVSAARNKQKNPYFCHMTPPPLDEGLWLWADAGDELCFPWTLERAQHELCAP